MIKYMHTQYLDLARISYDLHRDPCKGKSNLSITGFIYELIQNTSLFVGHTTVRLGET